jgi:hypothetical protein
VKAIGEGTGLEYKTVWSALNNEFFKKLPSGDWTLTEEGRAAAKVG